MQKLRSYVQGEWFEASSGFRPLTDPCSEEVFAETSTEGLDFAAVVGYCRDTGGPALRAMTLGERGAMLAAMSKALHDQREALIEYSVESCGTTRKDAKFDIDGASGTLYYYSTLAKGLEERSCFADGEGVQLGRSARSWGQHAWLPKRGVAVHINAFNFPAWGLAEKAACALLAGMPVLSKPATSTAALTARCVEAIVDSGCLPAGALSFVAGSVGDLFAHLGPQDVIAFTGSADTGRTIRGDSRVLDAGVKVNVEADSLNAAVLAPDVEEGSDVWDLFLRDVSREITQKSGQKCTAVRRILVPKERLDDVLGELRSRLEGVVVGNPRDKGVTMGPLATAQQLDDAVAGVAKLQEHAELVFGSGQRVDGIGNDAGRGYFFAPALLVAKDATAQSPLHEHEVFGPVATLFPYDGDAATAAKIVSLSEGTLVTSVYGDDVKWLSTYLQNGGAYTGRLYVGSEKGADQAPGSGLALPQVLHGGPGRAGGGEELGGLRGLALYQQRVAVMGDRAIVDRMIG
ncbi:MAG: 3,4-dehydroadipyl-CoA semialdehyde dehydrogenase [Planctomycetota bacterium]